MPAVSATVLQNAQQTTSKGGEPARIRAVWHAIQVLAVFSADEPQLGVSEIARRIGVHKSTVSRILATLEDARLVERYGPSSRLRLGAGIVALAGPLLANLDVGNVARPYLEQLAVLTRESVSLSIWNRGEAVNVEQVLGPGTIKHIAPVGRRNPAHATATGKVFLAHAGPDEIRETIARGLPRFTDRTIVDPDLLLEELAQIRHHGFARNIEELELNLVAVAAPARDHHGQVVAAVGISAPGFGVNPARLDQFAEASKQAAADISQRLGYAVPCSPEAGSPARSLEGRGRAMVQVIPQSARREAPPRSTEA